MNNTAITSGRLTVGKTYLFQNKADGGRSLNVWCSSPNYPAENLSNVCLWKTNTDDTAQQWILSRAENGANYVLKSVENSAKCLDLYTGSGDGANINAHLYSESSTSYLIFENGAYSNTVRIRLAGSTKNGYYLTANQGNPGTRGGKGVNSKGNVYFYSTLLTDNSQEWEVIEVDSSSGGETGEDGQKLRLPINGVNTLSASRTIAAVSSYKTAYGVCHYGADIACGGGTILKGLGNGTVVGTGFNAKEGNFISVKYPNCIPVSGGTYKDVIVRYFHMKSVSAKLNDAVTTSTTLGESGNTGAWAFEKYHVHIEVDTDTEYPNYTPSLQNSNNDGGGLYKGTDSCENPFDWFFTYSDQSKARYWDSDETWVFPEDMVEHSA